MNVLGLRAETDQARRQRAQKWKPEKETRQKRQRIARAGSSAIDSFVNLDLESLNKFYWKFAAFLNLLEIEDRDRSLF